MGPTLRPLSMGELLDRTFHLYRKNSLLFIGISSVPWLFLLVVKITVLFFFSRSIAPGRAVGITIALPLVYVLLAMVIGALTTAATTFAVSDLCLEKPTAVSSALRRVVPKLLKVLITSILYGIIIGLGLMLLIIPAFYFLGRYGLSGPAVVLEDIGPVDALGRSSDLTKNSIFRVLAIWLLTYVLVLVASAFFGALIGALGVTVLKHYGTTSQQAVSDVIGTVAQIFISPVMAIALTLLYYDQRVRKEAFDIENMMQLLGHEPPEIGVPTNA